MIKSIKLVNFKSFKNEKVNLKTQNIIIGNNASGKSNLIEAFKLIKDAFEFGVDNAYYMHGGFKAIYHRMSTKNISARDKELVSSIEVEYSTDQFGYYGSRVHGGSGKNIYRIRPDSVVLKLVFSRKGNYESQWYTLSVKYQLYKEKEEDNRYEFSVYADSSLPDKKKISIVGLDRLPAEYQERLKHQTEDGHVFHLLDKQQHDLTFAPFLISYFSDYYSSNRSLSEVMRFYDFDSHLVKSSTKLAGEELKEDGSNFAFVLRGIIKRRSQMKVFLNLVNRLLPSLQNFNTEVNSDGQLSIKYRESYSQKFLSGHTMSDGTAYLLALIAAVITTPPTRTLFFEEPDRYLHPGLSRQLVSIFDDTEDHQLIITTHNQEFLRHVRPENVKIIRKNNKGETEVVDADSDPKIKNFLEKGASLDELFINNVIT